MGAYVVRKSSLNDKHGCQLFKIDASFSSLVLLSSSVSTANLSCLPATTFSSLRFPFNSLSSPRFNLLRVARRCFSWFSIFSFSRSSVSEASFLLITRVSQVGFNSPKLLFDHAVFGSRDSAYVVNLTYDRHTDIPTYIYHPKSRLNTQCGARFARPINFVKFKLTDHQLLITCSAMYCNKRTYFQHFYYFYFV